MTTTKHTPGPWKILPCPVHGGKHPCHDNRWIATDDAEVEHSTHDESPDQWHLSAGSLICQMRDGPTQNARLIAAAPELLEALKAVDSILNQPWKDCNGPHTLTIAKADCSLAQKVIAAAIAKATGKKQE